jgi:hypothetical protein
LLLALDGLEAEAEVAADAGLVLNPELDAPELMLVEAYWLSACVNWLTVLPVPEEDANQTSANSCVLPSVVV